MEIELTKASHTFGSPSDDVDGLVVLGQCG
jgi:hypothetical protein